MTCGRKYPETGYTGSLAVPAKWVSNPFSGFDASMAFLVLIYFLVGAMIYAVMWLTNALKGENPTRTFAIGMLACVIKE
jgi:hypothetical protein